MRKITIISIFILFLLPAFFFYKSLTEYEILGYDDATNLLIDTNHNNQIDDNENYHLIGLFANTSTENNYPNYKLTKQEKLYLEYKFKLWANKNLLNKKISLDTPVEAELEDFVLNNESYKKIVLSNGFAQTKNNKDYKFIKTQELKKELNKIKTQNIVVLNEKNNKYHKLDCTLIPKLQSYKIIPYKNLPKNSSPCKICHRSNYKKNHKQYNKYTETSKQNNTLELENFTLYFINFNNLKYPYNNCKIPACKSLLEEINKANESIDFAIYGINNQPLIYQALVTAQKRGVKIRWISDYDSQEKEQYPDNSSLSNILTDHKTDKLACKKAIMHNKFFIFDNRKVWTGSANITDTDLSNFNANFAALIQSKKIAEAYKKEFDQMYKGNFHTDKKTFSIEKVKISEVNTIQPMFSPQDKIISSKIAPIIDSARKYVYMPIFYLTHKGIADALIRAQKRGVEVKVITDATNARGKYSIHTKLREAGIKVKTENKAGKMHMKAIVIDDKYSIIGSMNFTKSGESYNDENILIIENIKTSKFLKTAFITMWKSIPDKYLTKDPRAEGFESIGSCNDSIDNDFDGKIDAFDEGCIFNKKQN